MRKALVTVLAVTFALCMAGAAHAKFQCTVEKVESDRMVLKGCEVDKAAKMKPGDAVNVTKNRPEKPEKPVTK